MCEHIYLYNYTHIYIHCIKCFPHPSPKFWVLWEDKLVKGSKYCLGDEEGELNLAVY